MMYDLLVKTVSGRVSAYKHSLSGLATSCFTRLWANYPFFVYKFLGSDVVTVTTALSNSFTPANASWPTRMAVGEGRFRSVGAPETLEWPLN